MLIFERNYLISYLRFHEKITEYMHCSTFPEPIIPIFQHSIIPIVSEASYIQI